MKHPRPDEAPAWFGNTVSRESLALYIAALRTDPHWRVIVSSRPEGRTLVLLHAPTGQRLEIALRGDGAIRRMPGR